MAEMWTALDRALDRMRPAPASSLSVTVEHLSPREFHSFPEAPDTRRWLVEDVVDVSVDGDGTWDPEEDGPVPAVVLRMPAHVARHLACVLDDWTTIGRILESARATDERDLAGKDPEEVLRRMLAISPEDAEEVREKASEKAAPRER